MHLGLVVAEVLCVSAFWLELIRALDGNSLSWAYVFEWPIFAIYALYVWRRLLRDERIGPRQAAVARPEASDAALDEYNRYLEKVHDRDDDTPRSSLVNPDPGQERS